MYRKHSGVSFGKLGDYHVEPVDAACMSVDFSRQELHSSVNIMKF